MSSHWYTYPDAEHAAEACARQIFLRLDEALSGHSTATLAISGGSTPKLMFPHLARPEFDWSRVHLFWVDERAVPPTDPESNYGMAEEYFLKPAHFPHRNVHRIHGELRPDLAAEKYAAEIEEVFRLPRGELPHFDVMHMGLGPDAHTASLFPGEPMVEDRRGIAAGVFVEKLNRWRVTLLPGVILNAKHTLMLVAGKDKAEAVKAVTEGDYNLRQYPAQLISHHGRHVTWFFDKEAVSLVAA